MPMEPDELEEFREMLKELRRKVASNVTHMQNEALRNKNKKVSELSDVPFEHLADRGSDNFAQDLMIGILQNTESELSDIDDALARIEEGTYGICEGCDEPIARARLKALPFARYCITCKQEEEREQALQ